MRTCGVVEVAVFGMGDGSIARIKDLKETSLLFAIEGLKKPGAFVTATTQLGLPGRTPTDRLNVEPKGVFDAGRLGDDLETDGVCTTCLGFGNEYEGELLAALTQATGGTF